MPTDSRTVLIVGGGIAGLSAAYGLAESAASHDSPTPCTLVESAPRLGAELLIQRRRGRGDESLGSFFRRRLGNEALERIIEPLMTGIYAGDADSLSIQATFPRFPEMEHQAGSIVRALLGSWRRHQGAGPGGSPFVTLQGGLSEMLQALTARLGHLRVLTGRRVRAVRVSGVPRGYEVVIEGTVPLVVDALILATPAYDAATLLELLDDELSALLRGIPYTSTATISLGFRRRDFSHRLDGYGFVVPRIAGSALLAVTWTSSKWSHRAPDDAVLLRAYVGGAGPEAVLERSDDGLVSLVRAELRAMMGITEEPVLARVYRWPRAMPQYL